MAIKAVDPTTGETIREYEEMSAPEVGEAVERTYRAFRGWRRTPFAERAAMMRQAAQVLRDRAEDYARLMAREMGKPVRGGRSEAEKCA